MQKIIFSKVKNPLTKLVNWNNLLVVILQFLNMEENHGTCT